jgi:hypothetical protein
MQTSRTTAVNAFSADGGDHNPPRRKVKELIGSAVSKELSMLSRLLIWSYRSIEAEVNATIPQAIVRGDFILGSAVEEFETAFARIIGVEFGIGVSSGMLYGSFSDHRRSAAEMK